MAQDLITTTTSNNYLKASTLDCLPPELLGEIFLNLVASDPDNQRKLVTIVSLVCSYWYIVASSTPQLWTKFVYTSSGKTPSRNVVKWLQRFSTCRCDNLPFELVLMTDHYTWPKIKEALSIASSTVTSLNLYVSRSTAMLAMFNPIQFAGLKSSLGSQLLIRGWDRLEKLTLALHEEETKVANFWPLRHIQEPDSEVMAPMPRLTHLSLQSFTRAHGHFVNFTFPWAQLVSLEIGRYLSDPDGILRVLQRCPNLEDCRLHLLGLRWWQLVMVEGQLSLPKLRRLAVLEDAWLDHGHLFRWILEPLCAPALEYLELKIGDMGRWDDLNDTLQFIRRSGAKLRHLVLQNIQVEEEMLISLLGSEELQGLEILTLLECLNLMSPTAARTETDATSVLNSA
ncbi:hypothetical protein MD484_g428, partial [Candolleomyces efflorescens]